MPFAKKYFSMLATVVGLSIFWSPAAHAHGAPPPFVPNPNVATKVLLNRLTEIANDLQIQARLLIRDEAVMPVVTTVTAANAIRNWGWNVEVSQFLFVGTNNHWPGPSAASITSRLNHLKEQSLQMYEMWCAKLGFRFPPRPGMVRVLITPNGPKAVYATTGPVFDPVAYQIYVRDFDYITYRNSMAAIDLLLFLYGKYNPFRATKIANLTRQLWDSIHQLRHVPVGGFTVTKYCYECTFPYRPPVRVGVAPAVPRPLFHRQDIQREFAYPGIQANDLSYQLYGQEGQQFQTHPENYQYQYQLERSDYENLTPPADFAPQAPEGQGQPGAGGGVPPFPVDPRARQGQQPGAIPGQQPGMIPGQQPGVMPGQQPGVFPGQQPGMLPGQQPGVMPGQQPGINPGQQPGMPGQRPGVMPGQQPGVMPGQQPGVFPGQQPGVGRPGMPGQQQQIPNGQQRGGQVVPPQVGQPPNLNLPRYPIQPQQPGGVAPQQPNGNNGQQPLRPPADSGGLQI